LLQNKKSFEPSLDDLMLNGELSYDDYIDIIHELELALNEEMERDIGAN